MIKIKIKEKEDKPKIANITKSKHYLIQKYKIKYVCYHYFQKYILFINQSHQGVWAQNLNPAQIDCLCIVAHHHPLKWTV
jgi:hypothetical protein